MTKKNRSIEDILGDIKENSSSKPLNLQQKCTEALELLSSEESMKQKETWQIRHVILQTLKHALESKTSRLTALAVAGIQNFLYDDRFYSALEPENEENLMPMQLLGILKCIPNLPEELQMEMMKILLNLTCSPKSIVTARVVIRVAEVCLDSYSANSGGCVRTAVRATLTQLLTALTDKLDIPSINDTEHCHNDMIENNEGHLMDDLGLGPNFKEMNAITKENADSLARDVISVLCFISAKLHELSTEAHLIHLLLEALLAVLDNLPPIVGHRKDFVDLTWKTIVPILVSFLSNPTTDKLISRDGQGERGGGYSSTNSTTILSEHSVKTVYQIAVQLIRIVGDIHSLRAPLASLLHRIYLYSPPSSRVEALKCLKDVLTSPYQLTRLASPTVSIQRGDDKQRLYAADLMIIKIISRSLRECCSCKDSTVVLNSVSLMCELVSSLSKITKGNCITDEIMINLLSSASAKPVASESSDSLQPSENLDVPGKIVLPHYTYWKSDDSSDSEMDQRLMKASQLYERRDVESIFASRQEVEELERDNARHFIDSLIHLVPELLDASSISEVDELLLSFSSNFCKEMENSSKKDSYAIILNADAIYVTTIYALHLNLILMTSSFYSSDDVNPSIKQEEFCDEILNCGLLLFVSQTWLEEVWMQIISRSIFKSSQIKLNEEDEPILITTLTDIDGLRSSEMGGQLLRSANTERIKLSSGSAVKAGQIAAKNVLSTIWNDMMEVLSTLITCKHSIAGFGESLALLFNAKEENRKAREAICTSLDALRTAAGLAYGLGLQNLCGSVLAQLADASCRLADGEARLHAAHALSLDSVLSMGLELGSHSPDCWQHVFRCCAHVALLEHTTFSKGQHQSVLPQVTQKTGIDEEEQEAVDVVIPSEPVAPSIDVLHLVKESSTGWQLDAGAVGGVLSVEQSARALCGLSQQVDRLFDEAAAKLNLQSLTSFIFELCRSSREQLTLRKTSQSPDEKLPANVIFVYRLGDILMNLIDSCRPMLHVIRSWSLVAAHLVEAACEKEMDISRRAVESIHGIVSCILNSRPETYYFHFHEALCKPFENLLSLELCDPEVQDQVICSLCSLVESSASELKSGWRSVFSALKSIKLHLTAVEEINESRISHVTAVLDVFNAFLSTDNPSVIAQASVDCILCLLHYAKGELEEDSKDDSDEDDDAILSLSAMALNYLKECSNLLSKMKIMPACPVFSGAYRIQFGCKPHLVDAHFGSQDLEYIINLYKNNQDVRLRPEFVDEFVYKLGLEAATTIDDLNDSKGVLRVWLLILDGLVHTAATCPKQPNIVGTLFELLRETIKPEHADFGIHVINHVILPEVQAWIRKGDENSLNLANIRQCTGLITDFIVETIVQLVNESELTVKVELMLKQLLDVLMECISQPIEQLARVGTACMRHTLLSASALFTERMWHIACSAIARAGMISLIPLREILSPFHAHSDNFYGDVGSVKVAVRQEGSAIDAERLRSLANQVFLIEVQRNASKPIDYSVDTDRSFVFLLEPPDTDILRVPFRNVVIGLIAHQQLVKLVAAMTLEDYSSSYYNNILNMSARNVLLLLELLKHSQSICEAFDSRPGLKFLVQKVARANVASNLYAFASSAIQLRIRILIHIVSNLTDLSVNLTKSCLSEETKEKENDRDIWTSSGKVSEYGSFFIRLLKEALQELCVAYVDLYLDKYTASIVDKISTNQTLYFLLADEGEEITELKRDKSLKDIVAEKVKEFSSPTTTGPVPLVEQQTLSDDEELKLAPVAPLSNRKNNDKVYSVATESTINDLMSQYKKRKNQHTLPSPFQKQTRSKPQPVRKPRPKRDDSSREREIDDEQNESLVKDSEAALTCWVTTVCETLNLLYELPDEKFKALLPVVVSSVTQLICHSRDAKLRESLAKWTYRVSHIYGFAEDKQN
ncbi:DgyrCDS11305 [Dimorphilus gyrociliatus]|uniref:DgyrCDS11305 n=1 Tax=Dimorphilus gyrociliatus TaxID=2664684 RepID=A0A7I8W474_9ANNE|nr:DgyrCDS11305 [Dimorphilus gyrociliatus]